MKLDLNKYELSLFSDLGININLETNYTDEYILDLIDAAYNAEVSNVGVDEPLSFLYAHLGDKISDQLV